MGRFSGSETSVGWGKEVTPGTPVAPGYWVPETDLDFDDKITKVLNTSSFGTLDKNVNAHVVTQWGEGTIKGVVYRNSFGLLLASLFGATSTDSVVETTAKKHAFTMANNNAHLSLTLARTDPDNASLRFALARIDELQMSYVTNNYVTYSAKYISKNSVTASDTATYVAETEFIPKHAIIKNAAVGVANLTGATALTNIKAVTLTIKKNVKPTQGLGNVSLENVVNTELEVTGTIERYYDDNTFKGYWQANTHRSLRIELTDTDTTVGAITNPDLTFDMDEVVFTDWKENAMAGSDVVTETISFTAIRNFTSAKTIIANLTNDVASY